MKYIITLVILFVCTTSVTQQNRKEIHTDLSSIDKMIHSATMMLGIGRFDVDVVYNLCGNNTEILLKIDNTMVVYGLNRNTEYVDFLTPGRYITTDNNGCKYKITKNLNLKYI
jgi:hypothetical protein